MRSHRKERLRGERNDGEDTVDADLVHHARLESVVCRRVYRKNTRRSLLEVGSLRDEVVNGVREHVAPQSGGVFPDTHMIRHLGALPSAGHVRTAAGEEHLPLRALRRTQLRHG